MKSASILVSVILVTVWPHLLAPALQPGCQQPRQQRLTVIMVLPECPGEDGMFLGLHSTGQLTDKKGHQIDDANLKKIVSAEPEEGKAIFNLRAIDETDLSLAILSQSLKKMEKIATSALHKKPIVVYVYLQ